MTSQACAAKILGPRHSEETKKATTVPLSHRGRARSLAGVPGSQRGPGVGAGGPHGEVDLHFGRRPARGHGHLGGDAAHLFQGHARRRKPRKQNRHCRLDFPIPTRVYTRNKCVGQPRGQHINHNSINATNQPSIPNQRSKLWRRPLTSSSASVRIGTSSANTATSRDRPSAKKPLETLSQRTVSRDWPQVRLVYLCAVEQRNTLR